MAPRAGDAFLTYEQRFWSRVDKSEGCWIWTGGTNTDKKPYGLYHWRGRHTSAHRVAYELAVGRIPDGFDVDHLYGTSLCCNPAHLEAVPPAENRRRQFERQTHCHRGHALSGANVYVDPKRGARLCRTCRRLATIRRYA